MKLIHRRTFFWTAVFLFLVAAPLLILNASGFRYDFQEKSLIQTGTLILKTQLAGARVWINQEEQAAKTPAEIASLLPQRYSIRIEADHFHPWQKEVEVREAEITLKDKILLIPKEIPLSLIASKGIRTFALAPDGRHLAYARKGEGPSESVWLLHLDEGKEQLFFVLEDEAKKDERKGEQSPVYSIDRLFWSSDSRHIAIAVSTPEKDLKRYFLIETETEESPFEVVLSGREDFSEWKWSEDGRSFFFIHQQFLYRADPVKRTIEQVVPEPVTGYTTLGDALYFVSATASALFKKELLSGKQTLIRRITPTEPGDTLENLERFVLSGDGKMALLDRGRKLWLVDLKAESEDSDEASEGTDQASKDSLEMSKGSGEGSSLQLIASHVKDASFSDDGKKLLFQTGKGLFVHDLTGATPHSDRKGGSTEMLIQQKEPAFGSVWYSDQAHVLFGLKDTIFIAETGEGGRSSIYPLIRTPGESPRFLYSSKIKEKLYLVYEDQLYQADLSFEKPVLDLSASGDSKAPDPSSRPAQDGRFERIQEGPKAVRSPESLPLKVRS